MQIEFVAVSDYGLKPAAEVLARAFADYFVKISSTEAVLWAMARGDSVDFTVSRVALLDGQPVGAALVSRRGWTCRLAGMALVPEARGRKVGRALVTQLIAEAKARGDRTYVLEVIEQNEPAVKLYSATGFEKVRRLVGFAGPAPVESESADALTEIDVRAAAAAATNHHPQDWPWQLSGETIAQLSAPHTAFALDGAWVALTNLAGSPVSVRTFAVSGPERREERAGRLLRAVMARYPGKEWRISALWPEEAGGWFTQAGLVRQPMTQWQMSRSL